LTGNRRAHSEAKGLVAALPIAQTPRIDGWRAPIPSVAVPAAACGVGAECLHRDAGVLLFERGLEVLDAVVDDLADEGGVCYDPEWGAGKLILELFEKLVEEALVEPTLVKDFPLEVSPLARTHRDDPRLTEHFDLIMGGVELAPAYSELADPDEQRARFEDQQRQRAAGEEEAHPFDEEFLLALEDAYRG
jgi:elongation factor P--beta-lysine ligase